MDDVQTAESAQKQAKAKLNQVLFFGAFSILEAGCYFMTDASDRRHPPWFFGAGALFFLGCAALSGMSLMKGWSVKEEDRAFQKASGWLVGLPIVIGILAIAFLGVAWVFGWFASIPSWAAVIIILLVLLLLKK